MFNHMFDLAFSIETSQDGEAIFDKKNMPALIAAARKRLDDIEKEGDTSAFGLCDTYETDHLSRSQ